VLDLAPGAMPIRLTVFSKGAIEEISKIKSPHLEIMVTTK
jgi:large subunit ribosomal protein L4e